GVGPGLGQANARALAREGATVVLAARNAAYLDQVRAEIEGAGGRALALPTNLVEPDQVRALVDGTLDAYGRLDGLVNNAFRMDTFESFEAVDLVKWRKIFEVNVWGALGLTQACLPHLKKAATFIGWESESRGISRDDVRAEIEARIPLRIIPPQDEIANSVVFFVSP